MEDSPGISNVGFNKRSTISSVRLGPVTTLLGYSVMECGEELVSMTVEGLLPESPTGWFWEELSAIECPHWWTPSPRVVALAE